MKKLTEETARYAIVKTAFHGGGTISFHRSLDAAIKAANRYINAGNCSCGCAGVRAP